MRGALPHFRTSALSHLRTFALSHFRTPNPPETTPNSAPGQSLTHPRTGAMFVPGTDLAGHPCGGYMALRDRFTGLSVADALALRAQEDPRRPFVVFGDRRCTYAQVDAQSSALAAALHEL